MKSICCLSEQHLDQVVVVLTFVVLSGGWQTDSFLVVLALVQTSGVVGGHCMTLLELL